MIVLLVSVILHNIIHTVVLVVPVGQLHDGNCRVGPDGEGVAHIGPSHGQRLQLQDGVLHDALAVPASYMSGDCQMSLQIIYHSPSPII